MMRSLYSGVAGLRIHQTRMDVIGNNIANVNTPGYKKSRTIFQDMMSQVIRVASEPDANLGGMNAIQIGLGVSLGSIDVLHTQGAAASTGNNMDLMIQGDGYFIVEDDAGNRAYTRAGNFGFDESGNLIVTSTGMFVLDSEEQPIVISEIADDTGYVKNIGIDAQGFVVYTDQDGIIQRSDDPIGIAKFSNPMGLEKIGQNMFATTNNSGFPQISTPNGIHGQGGILPGSLEMSNVDLAEEFTDMIITQRGHQANARTIRTSDEMLQELSQLKR